MAKTVTLPSSKDRLRYSLMFEASMLALLLPAGAVFFDKPISDTRVLGLMPEGRTASLGAQTQR